MNKKQKKQKKNKNQNNKDAHSEIRIVPESIKPPSDNELNIIVSSIENNINKSQTKIYEVNNTIKTLRTSICNIEVNNEAESPVTPPIDENIPLYEFSTTDTKNIISSIKNLLKSVEVTPETSEIRKLIGELDLYIISLQENEKNYKDEINGLNEEISSLSNLLKSENPTLPIDSIINPPLSYESYQINQCITNPQIINQSNNNNTSYSTLSSSSSSKSNYSSDNDSDNETSEGYNSEELINEIQKYMPNDLNLREILPPKNIEELIEIESNYGFKILQFDSIDVEISSEEEDTENDGDDEESENEELELCYLDRINIIYNKNLNQSNRPTPISNKSRRFIHHYNSGNKNNNNKSTNQITPIDSNKKRHSILTPSQLSSSIVGNDKNNINNNKNNNINNKSNSDSDITPQIQKYKIQPSNYNLIDEVNGLEYSFNNSIAIISERDITKELIEKNEIAEYKDKELRLQAERLGNKVYDSESDTLSCTSESSTGSFMNSNYLSISPQIDDKELLLSNDKLKKQINEKINEYNNSPFKVIKEEVYPLPSKLKFRQPNFNKEFEDEKCRINHFLTINNDVIQYNYCYNNNGEIQSNSHINNNNNSLIDFPDISFTNDSIELKEVEYEEINIQSNNIMNGNDELSVNTFDSNVDYICNNNNYDNEINEVNEICFESDIQMIVDPILLKMNIYDDNSFTYNLQDIYIQFSEEYFNIMVEYFEYTEFSFIDILCNDSTKEKETETEVEETKPPVEDPNIKKIKMLEKQISALKRAIGLNLKKSKYTRLIRDYQPVYSLEYEIYEHILSLSNVESYSYSSYYVEKEVKEEEEKEEENEIVIKNDEENEEEEKEKVEEREGEVIEENVIKEEEEEVEKDVNIENNINNDENLDK